MEKVREAVSALKKGSMVMIYDADGREEETDFVKASQFIGPEDIRIMRAEFGGLICVTVDPDVQEKLGLPYLTDVYERAWKKYPLVKKLIPNDIPYDEKSAFSLTINHRKTFTGINDFDRAMTIKEFAQLCERAMEMSSEKAQEDFGRNFRSPGHVHLLNASRGLLSKRKGHTEISTALMHMAGLVPSATICEMIGDDGRSTGKRDALRYSKAKGLVFIEGNDIIAHWESNKEGI